MSCTLTISVAVKDVKLNMSIVNNNLLSIHPLPLPRLRKQYTADIWSIGKAVGAGEGEESGTN